MTTVLPLSHATASPRGKQGVLLGWGFAASVLLVLISTFFSVWQISRAKNELMQLFEASERSTYLIGHIGQQLSRMRLLLREGLDHVTGSGEAPGGSFASLDATVRASLKELEPLLSARERSSGMTWSRRSSGSEQISGSRPRLWRTVRLNVPDVSWPAWCLSPPTSWRV
jgi:hypothetical protein